MPETYYTGARATSATLGVSSDQLRVEMADKIFRLEPDNNPLLRLTTKLGKEVTRQVDFKHLESNRHDRYTQVNNGAGYASGDTSIVVDTGGVARAGYLLRNLRTNEVMRVTAVSTNTLTVVRSWGATAAAAINDNDYLLAVGDSHAQGATAPDAKSVSPTTKTNNTQIFKFPWEVTGTAAKVEYYGEDELARLGKDAGLEHAEQIERAFFFGEKAIDNTGDTPIYTTGGLYEWVTSNVDTQTELTQQEFHDWMRKVFAYGSSEKWLFCSPLIVSALDWWGIGKLQTSVTDKVYGVTVLRWHSSHGIVNIVNHIGFARWGYDGTVAGAIAFAVDADAIGYRYIRDRDTHIQLEIQNKKDDKVTHQYLTECGLWVRNEKRHAILKGITSYV